MWTLHVQSIHGKATKRLFSECLSIRLRGKHLSRFILHLLDLLWNIQMLSGKASKMLEDVQVEAGRIIM